MHWLFFPSPILQSTWFIIRDLFSCLNTAQSFLNCFCTIFWLGPLAASKNLSPPWISRARYGDLVLLIGYYWLYTTTISLSKHRPPHGTTLSFCLHFLVNTCRICASPINKNDMQKLKLLLLGSTLLLASGCATVISGTTQQVHVKVVDTNNNLLKNATCSVSNGSADYEFESNPATIMVNKNESLVIKCRDKGYKQKGKSFW